MRQTFLFLSLCFCLCSCSDNNIDDIVSKKWEQCINKSDCIIDFSQSMNFEWETMYYYSGANSLEDINNDLGFELKEYTDVGDRIIFLNKGKVVYQQESFKYPSKPIEGIIFETNLNKFKLSRKESQFRVRKEGGAYYLKKI